MSAHDKQGSRSWPDAIHQTSAARGLSRGVYRSSISTMLVAEVSGREVFDAGRGTFRWPGRALQEHHQHC